MGSYLKHMDVVIFSSCAALPLGHSLFNEERGGGNGEKEKKNFHMLTFTQWFLLIALYFLICPGLMLLKAGLEVFYWSRALCRNKFSWLPRGLASLALSYLTTCVIPFTRHVKHATQHLDLERRGGTHRLGELPLRVPSSKDYDKVALLVLGERQSRK